MIAKQIAEFLTELHSVKISAPERFELKEFKNYKKMQRKSFLVTTSIHFSQNSKLYSKHRTIKYSFMVIFLRQYNNKKWETCGSD